MNNSPNEELNKNDEDSNRTKQDLLPHKNEPVENKERLLLNSRDDERDTAHTVVDICLLAMGLIPGGSTIKPFVQFFLSKLWGPSHQQDILEIIHQQIGAYAQETTLANLRAVKMEANSLQDAIDDWQQAPSASKLRLIIIRNENTLALLRLIYEDALGLLPSYRGYVSQGAALVSVFYFSTLRDTLHFGSEWGYASHQMLRFNQELSREGDRAFQEIIDGHLLEAFDKDGRSALKALIYWTSRYTNYQRFLPHNQQRNTSCVIYDSSNLLANDIRNGRKLICLGQNFRVNGETVDNDISYGYISAAANIAYSALSVHRFPIQQSGTYTLKLFYGWMFNGGIAGNYLMNGHVICETGTNVVQRFRIGDLHLEEQLCPDTSSQYKGIQIRAQAGIALVGGETLTIRFDFGSYGLRMNAIYLQHVEFDSDDPAVSIPDRTVCTENQHRIHNAMSRWWSIYGREGMHHRFSWNELVPQFLPARPLCPSHGTYEFGWSTVSCSVHGAL